MSMEVHHFLNDSGGNFTETAPRPPVPGEENELQSNGGNSTRSSGSYKSHVSAKSVASNMAHSPAATPRRSNLDRNNISSINNISSMSLSDSKLFVDSDPDKYLAPLGFEPEGSAASSPHFNENSTPPYLKWAESFDQLLDDSEGVKLFKQFCDQEQCTNSLDFFFACKGIKLAGSDRLLNVAKVIYKKFIKGEKLNIRPETKRAIVERLKTDQVDARIFEVAQAEVESAMQGEAYPLFLKSDIYVQYVQAGGESPKTANSSGSNSARPMSSGPLPTLHEGEELSQEDIRRTNTEPTLTLTPEALIFTHEQRSKWNNFRRPDGLFPPGSAAAAAAKAGSGRMVNPYHVSYAPVSAQDSELQSLSSDAHTDDTMSLTDSSVDGRDLQKFHNSKAWKKHIRRNAKTNRHTDMDQQFIPRTDRAPKDRNLAEKEPKKFAAMLMAHLQVVKEERDKLDKMRESLHTIETPEEDSTKNAFHTLFASAIAEKDHEDDNAQSILEEHMSRVWDSSNGQTPSRSPGRHSPSRGSGTSPDRLAGLRTFRGGPYPTPNTSSSLLNATGRRRKDKDGVSGALLSNSSYDSGMGVEERTGVYYEGEMPGSGMHKHYYHLHHHNHHHVSGQSKDSSSSKASASRMVQSQSSSSSLPSVADDRLSRSLQHYPSTPAMPQRSLDDRGRSRDTKRSKESKPVKRSDASLDTSTNDHLTASFHDPTNNKVMAWMMENEKVAPSTTQYSTDGSDRSSHKRSSHKSSSSTSAYKSTTSSSNKKPFSSNSRSGSLDRSGHYVATSQDYAPNSSMGMSASYGVPSALPSQPIVQDPCMPLLTPPKTITQLEEAKRRLEDETRAKHMLKSKSYTSGLSKDKHSMPPPRSSNIPQTAPLDLSSSEEYSSSSQKSEKRSSRSKPVVRGSNSQSSHSLPSTPSTCVPSESTTVAYFFGNEPIPYRSSLAGRNITLAQFKQLIGKRGHYRYFFKKADNEFDSGCVHEEFFDDSAILPIWEGKIIGKVDKVE